MSTTEHVTKRALTLLNTLHHKDAKAFAAQYLAAGDSHRWPFLNVLPGAVIVKDSAKLITMHDAWFPHPETAFKPYHDGLGLNREFQVEDLIYCEPLAGSAPAVRCGVNAYVKKEKILGAGGREIVTVPMHLSLIFAFDEETEAWWVTQINNTPLEVAGK